MATLEQLPNELQSMLLELCPPRDLLSLISASPVSLWNFNERRRWILGPHIAVFDAIRPHARKEALDNVRLRLLARNAGAMDGSTLSEAIEPLVKRVTGLSVGHRLRKNWTNSLPFLACLADVVGELENLTKRVVPNSETASKMLSYWTRQPIPNVSAPIDIAVWYKQVAFIRFDAYCQAFFHGGHVLHREAVEGRDWFYKRHDEILPSTSGYPYILLHLAMHYIFQEHKAIVQDAARDLGTGANDSCGMVVWWKHRLGVDEEWAGLAGKVSLRQFKQALESRQLEHRRLAEEDGYCRYLMSFGTGLLTRLHRMTRGERRKFTLATFFVFSMKQMPRVGIYFSACGCLQCEFGWQGCRRRLWDKARKRRTHSTWSSAVDRSRMAYCAWYWDLALAADIGSISV